MKKTLMPLLIAAAVALSACGQDLSGGDWRTTGVVQAAGTISRSGADTDVLVCVHEGDAVFYRDSADQELFGQVVYPMDVQDPWDTFAAIDFADRNGDGVVLGRGNRGVRVPAGGIRLHRDGGVAALGGSGGGLHHLAG